MENLAKSFCVLLDGIYQRDKEIASLKERLEAWRAWYIDPDQDRTKLQDLGEI